MSGAVRPQDAIGRYGGEEFLLLMPDTGRLGAVQLAEKTRSQIAQISLAGVDRSITASLGVAVLPDDAVDPESLIRKADRALDSAKAQGRNRVLVADAGNEATETAPTRGV